MVVAWRLLSRSADDAAAGGAAPLTGREAVLLSWCGMRGLATLALALSLPLQTASGAPFPARDQLVLIAVSVLFVTLLVPGFTLGMLVRALDIDDEADARSAPEREIVLRARRAAVATLEFERTVRGLPEEVGTAMRERVERLERVLSGETALGGGAVPDRGGEEGPHRLRRGPGLGAVRRPDRGTGRAA
jgi:hypothetical protein